MTHKAENAVFWEASNQRRCTSHHVFIIAYLSTGSSFMSFFFQEVAFQMRSCEEDPDGFFWLIGRPKLKTESFENILKVISFKVLNHVRT